MKRVLVVGGNGFLGSHIGRFFFDSGNSVFGVGASGPGAELAGVFTEFREIRLPSDDLTELVKEIRPEIVVNCAGAALVARSFESPGEDFRSNVSVVASLLDALRIVPESRFVQLSSAAVYGEPECLPVRETDRIGPISPYGYHKHMAELLCREYAEVFGLKTASLRIFSAYGAGLRKQVVWDLCQQASETDRIEVKGTGKETRDFIHASDVARAIGCVIERGPMAGECYNAGSGNETEIGSLAQMLSDAFGVSGGVRFSGEALPGSPLRWVSDSGRLRGLGFTCEKRFAEGIADYVEWFQSTK